MASFESDKEVTPEEEVEAGKSLIGKIQEGNIEEVTAICLKFKGNANVLHYADPDMGGVDPLTMACFSEKSSGIECAKCLLEAGTKVEDAPAPMQPLIAGCVSTGNVELMRLLVSKGAKVSVQCYNDLKGQTPLHLAVQGGLEKDIEVDVRKEMTIFLIENGADSSVKNDDDKTALDLANESTTYISEAPWVLCVFDEEFKSRLRPPKVISGVATLKRLLKECAAVGAPLVAMNKTEWDSNGENAHIEAEEAMTAFFNWMNKEVEDEEEKDIPGLAEGSNPRHIISANFFIRWGDDDDDYACNLQNYVWSDRNKFEKALGILDQCQEVGHAAQQACLSAMQREKLQGLVMNCRKDGSWGESKKRVITREMLQADGLSEEEIEASGLLVVDDDDERFVETYLKAMFL